MKESNILYAISIAYTLVFSILLLASGLWLFFLAGSWRDEALTKSLEGVLEIAVPHLFAVSTLAFILSHFLLFIDSVDKKKALKFITVLYIAILFENISKYFVSLEWSFFIWINIFLILLFTTLLCQIIYKISIYLYQQWS